MPKLKQTDTQKVCELLTAKAKYAIECKATSIDTLAIIWGIDKSGVYRKLNNIEKITVGDLIKLCKSAKLKIIIEEKAQPCVIGGD